VSVLAVTDIIFSTQGGSERLSLYHAPIFESTQPCGYTPPAGTGCGTAYGYVPGESTPFTSLPAVNSNHWGWVLQGPLPIAGPLYMGAGQNDLSKGTIVGSFAIAHVGSNLVITYTTNAPYVITEDHFYYSATLPNKVAPGQFGHSHSFTGVVRTDTFTVPFISGNPYYIVHAAIGNPTGTTSCGD
jgi:hypothetical protein